MRSNLYKEFFPRVQLKSLVGFVLSEKKLPINIYGCLIKAIPGPILQNFKILCPV